MNFSVLVLSLDKCVCLFFLHKGKKLTWVASNLEVAVLTNDLFWRVGDNLYPQLVGGGSLGICWPQFRLTILMGCGEEQPALLGTVQGYTDLGETACLFIWKMGLMTHNFWDKKIQGECKCKLFPGWWPLTSPHIFRGCCGDPGLEEAGNSNEGPGNVVYAPTLPFPGCVTCRNSSWC